MREVTPEWTDELKTLAERAASLEQALGAELNRLQECELTTMDDPLAGSAKTMQGDA